MLLFNSRDLELGMHYGLLERADHSHSLDFLPHDVVYVDQSAFGNKNNHFVIIETRIITTEWHLIPLPMSMLHVLHCYEIRRPQNCSNGKIAGSSHVVHISPTCSEHDKQRQPIKLVHGCKWYHSDAAIAKTCRSSRSP